jgi:hypothetical protein
MLAAFRALSESAVPARVAGLAPLSQAAQLNAAGGVAAVHPWDGTESGLLTLASGSAAKFITVWGPARGVW